MRELLKAAISFNGTAVLDIISPCVTFNNHEESTKSYAYGKANEERLHEITFVPRLRGDHRGLRSGQMISVEDARGARRSS